MLNANLLPRTPRFGHKYYNGISGSNMWFLKSKVQFILSFLTFIFVLGCGGSSSNALTDTASNDNTGVIEDTGSTTQSDANNSNSGENENNNEVTIGGDSRLVLSSEEVGEREDGSGAFRTNCLESHINFDDPLVYPNQVSASHEHVFFGNTTINAMTTQQSLLEASSTTCDGGTLNRSAYWVPALYDQYNERITYVEPLFYYKTGYHLPAQSIQTLPEGLGMVAGHAHASSSQSTQVIKYRCNSWQSEQQWFEPGDPLDHVAYLPYCEVNDIVEIRIVFPQCWDGERLYASDQSHMAYPSEATPPITGTGSCPSTHPIAIPEISYNFAIYVTEETGSPDTWRFSCETNPGGLCAHADWMNGWDKATMQKIVDNCLKPAKECMVGLLGDGTRLRSVITE